MPPKYHLRDMVRVTVTRAGQFVSMRAAIVRVIAYPGTCLHARYDLLTEDCRKIERAEAQLRDGHPGDREAYTAALSATEAKP